ncbi:MAG: Trk system potassium transporter TrkA [Clostridia bacterium]
MKIIIVGAGKVGRTLASYLCKEDYEVTVIDKKESVLTTLINELDVQAVCGDGAICEILSEAQVEKAYLVITTTDSDELNLLCCMTARKMGARHCVARVRNPSYMPQVPFMKTHLGISIIVNPEFQTALELSRMLSFPSATKLESFAKNRIDLVEIKVNSGSRLINLSLEKIQRDIKIPFLVCVIERDGKTIIPDGSFVINENDKIHVTGSRYDLQRLCKSLGIFKNSVKSALIIGGGKIAYYLATQLAEMGVQVKIIENQQDRCVDLSERLPKASIIFGDGTDEQVLLEEGIETVDACISLTGIDEENMIISMYAQSKNIRKVVTKINRPALIDISKNLGNDTIISTKLTTVNTILRYIRAKQNLKGNSIKTLHKFVDGNVEALEFFITVPEKWLGVPLKKLSIKSDAIIAGIIRANKAIMPSGNEVIKLNDGVLVVTTNSHIQDISDIFN